MRGARGCLEVGGAGMTAPMLRECMWRRLWSWPQGLIISHIKNPWPCRKTAACPPGTRVYRPARRRADGEAEQGPFLIRPPVARGYTARGNWALHIRGRWLSLRQDPGIFRRWPRSTGGALSWQRPGRTCIGTPSTALRRRSCSGRSRTFGLTSTTLASFLAVRLRCDVTRVRRVRMRRWRLCRKPALGGMRHAG